MKPHESTLLGSFIAYTRSIRDTLEGYNLNPHLHVSIMAEGHPMTGDMRVYVRIDAGYDGVRVEALDPEAALSEFVRRSTFNRRNLPLMLPSGTPDVVDELLPSPSAPEPTEETET